MFENIASRENIRYMGRAWHKAIYKISYIIDQFGCEKLNWSVERGRSDLPSLLPYSGYILLFNSSRWLWHNSALFVETLLVLFSRFGVLEWYYRTFVMFLSWTATGSPNSICRRAGVRKGMAEDDNINIYVFTFIPTTIPFLHLNELEIIKTNTTK